MKNTTALILATMLLAGAASAQGYKPPRNALGQPDLEGAWTNATMTPQTRPAQYGVRRAMTPEEVAKIEGAAVAQDRNLGRTWLRVGARWRLDLPGFRPYLAASYQEPLSRDRPVRMDSATNLASYLGAQGSGQEFQRLWTFGVGVTF